MALSLLRSGFEQYSSEIMASQRRSFAKLFDFALQAQEAGNSNFQRKFQEIMR